MADVFFIVCDGLKGLPDASNAVFPATIVQACIIHLIRGTFRYASKKYWDAARQGPASPIYTGRHRRRGVGGVRGARGEVGQALPGDHRLWRAAWEQFIPFLDYDLEIRQVLCSHQRDRVPQRPLPAGGQRPRPLPDRAGRAEDACTWSPGRLDPKGTGQARWAIRWKPALNAFAVTFADRMPTENL